MQSKSRPTWAIKWNNLMWDFLSGPQRDEIHVFNLFAVVSNNTISPATTEIGIQQSVRDLIFLRVGGEANYTYFLRDRRQQQTIRCDIYIFIWIYSYKFISYVQARKSFSPLYRRLGFSPRSPRLFGERSVHQPGLCLADPAM